MEIQGIKVGTIITGPKWPETVEIKRADYSENYVHIVGTTTLSDHHIDQLIPFEERSDINAKQSKRISVSVH
jgi:hypothetical protein